MEIFVDSMKLLNHYSNYVFKKKYWRIDYINFFSERTKTACMKNTLNTAVLLIYLPDFF